MVSQMVIQVVCGQSDGIWSVRWYLVRQMVDGQANGTSHWVTGQTICMEAKNNILFIPVSTGLSSVEKYLSSELSSCRAFCSDDAFLNTM